MNLIKRILLDSAKTDKKIIWILLIDEVITIF